MTNSIDPPRKGAIPRPICVAELKAAMCSPFLAGKRSAIVACATGTNIAVAKP